MLHHIEVANFRALETFRMEQLGRINLLVGTNNCGKTSVLEAIHSLVEAGSSRAFLRSMIKRGEMYADLNQREYEVEHLFHGHRMDLGTTFTVSGRNGVNDYRVEASVVNAKFDPDVSPLRVKRILNIDSSSLGFLVKWFKQDEIQSEMIVPISKRGGLLGPFPERQRPRDDEATVFFITTEALSRDQIQLLLEEAMLTPEEETVLAALRTIEPKIERIAPVGGVSSRSGGSPRGGVAIKLAGQRVPIGSLGDGIWRLLGISLALVRARGGVLLVDEIDTGLHYSVLENMWRLLSETARRLEVQVFATTHSRDCYESLAAIAHPGGHDVTIQRIERGKPLAVAFSEAEIVQAAKRGIEVR